MSVQYVFYDYLRDRILLFKYHALCFSTFETANNATTMIAIKYLGPDIVDFKGMGLEMIGYFGESS